MFNQIMKLIAMTKISDEFRMNNYKKCYKCDVVFIADSENNLYRLLHRIVTTTKTFKCIVIYSKSRKYNTWAMTCLLNITHTM